MTQQRKNKEWTRETYWEKKEKQLKKEMNGKESKKGQIKKVN